MQTLEPDVQPKPVKTGNLNDDEYAAWIAAMQKRLDTLSAKHTIFQTAASNEKLWEIYLHGLPEAERQYHTCNACRAFVEHYGGLVYMDDRGRTSSVLWDAYLPPRMYMETMLAMANYVKQGTVLHPLLVDKDATALGQRITGIWQHFGLQASPAMLNSDPLHNAHQVMARKIEDAKLLMASVERYPRVIVEQAMNILVADELYRGEKVIDIGQWFYDLQAVLESVHQETHDPVRRYNVIWRYAATAPQGWCHIGSTMIGTLLDDLVAGLNLDEIKYRFRTKMQPDIYQRPQALPKAGNVARAEQIVAELESAGALDRRYAYLEELETVWRFLPAYHRERVRRGAERPRVEQPIFGDVPTKTELEAFTAWPTDVRKVPRATMTWVKFRDKVLPAARAMTMWADNLLPNAVGVLTAVNMGAPPILQWDNPERRNPVSWYFWMGYHSAQQWSLRPNTWVQVNAVALKPSMWHGGYAHQGVGVIFVLDGMRETLPAALCLFPEILKSEYHEVRATIEAYSNAHTLPNREQGTANGLMFGTSHSGETRVRVINADGQVTEYTLDRWD